MQANISSFECENIQPTRTITGLDEDIRNGFLERPRVLQPKYFYDERGSNLFTQICDTPEYYPTRTENSLLEQFSLDIISLANPSKIIELGSGNSQKTRHLFDACESLGKTTSYAPMDVCEEILIDSCLSLEAEYPWLHLQPLMGDFMAGLKNLPNHNDRNLILFLGGSIGNFSPDDANVFLQEIYQTMQSGDYFLLGADRKKELSVLNAAYNDAQGITAEFNLNILRVLNNELESNFNVNEFEHLAEYNNELDRIEMHLVSCKDQTVEINGINEQVRLHEGEKILTEISCKYSFEKLESLIEQSGFTIEQHYQPANKYFSLVLATK